uniref:Piezo non-specific cation channel R-Ras-binding domain-containing protein n=1 Tax=Romanomermis culicivorax TaxID=13658 RepID=A0A915JYQ0_ROMCU
MREKFDDKRSLMFLRDYSMSSTQKVIFDQESDIAWTISHPSRRKLLHNLRNSTSDMSLIFKWQFTRPRESSDKEPATQSSSTTILLKPRSPIRDQLVKLLNATMDDSNYLSDNGRQRGGDIEGDEPTSFGVVQINRTFPAFVELPPYGQVEPVRPMLQNFYEHNFRAKFKKDDENQNENRTRKIKNVNNNYHDFPIVEEGFTTLQLELRSMGRIFKTCNSETPKTCTSYRSGGSDYWVAVGVEPMGEKIATKNIEMVIFVDKVFPSALDVFTSKGIIGVYVVVVLAAGRFMRSLVVTSPLEIMITEMPNVDKILQLCLDIYLVREARDFFLELDLFAKLIFLIRSPETLIKWTRPKLKYT